MGRHPLQPPAGLGAVASGELEAVLVKTLVEISNNRLEAALSEITRVVESYPTFRLAHLIRGDLLLARTRPLTTVGNDAGAPADRLADLREEARARLARHHQARPVDQVPGYVLKLRPDQRHALIVDTERSSLYVFENRNGHPHYVADYYISIGRNGISKAREGDKKTPVGVYHVTSRLPRARLDALYGSYAELYGAGAFPLNYPNEWDRRMGRNGHGIWLHGTPYDTFSRPPRASDGCVVLTNQDLETLWDQLQTGLTPVIISHGVKWVKPEVTAAVTRELEQAMENWRRDWESRDMERYLRHYSKTFVSNRQDHTQWAAQKRQVNAGKTWIKVELDQVSMFLYPGNNNMAVVTFEQNYGSNNLSQRMQKRQYWLKESGGWRIIYEGTA